jgi:hypothetical protein
MDDLELEISKKQIELEELEKEYENLLKQKDNLISEKNEDSKYTVVIKVNSMEQLNKGIDIDINEKDKYIGYQKLYKCVPIGVVGNFDKGKSYISAKLSDMSISSGYANETEAISIKYPKTPSHGIAVYDSSGFETPILFYKDERMKGDLPDTEKMAIIRSMTIDRTHRENVLQQFILESSSIILLVVNKLEKADQTLYNRLKFISTGNNELCVIHNLSLIYDKSEVQKYIDTELKQCFNFEENKYIKLSSSLYSDGEQLDVNNIYYIDQVPTNVPKEFKKIAHFIIAREGTEAGNYYNPPAFEFFKNRICAVSQTKHINPIKDFAEFLERKRTTIFKDSLPIELVMANNVMWKRTDIKGGEEFAKKFAELEWINGPVKKIVVPHFEGLTELSVDELGFSTTSSQVERYRLLRNKDKFRIELAVYDIDLEKTEFTDYIWDSYSIFKVKGVRKPKPTGVDVISNSRDNADHFNFDVKVLAQDIQTDGEEPVAEYKDGVLSLTFNINKNYQPDE